MSNLDPTKFGVRVQCIICRRTKAPVGRSVPIPLANSMCDIECPGHGLAPRVGSLWPDESEADFGHPVGTVGTRIEKPYQERNDELNRLSGPGIRKL